MNKRGGLKSLTFGFMRHFLRGEPAQFVVNEWKDFLCRRGVAVRCRFE